LVAWAELHQNDDVTLHFSVPRATVVSGVQHSAGSPPAASDHWFETFTGTVAAAIKKLLLDLV
jgi:hypothetical protein